MKALKVWCVLCHNLLLAVFVLKELRIEAVTLSHSKNQVSSEFGYNIENERSSHFRREQRNQDGVVRGTYGLRNPSGSYRLVHYIADSRGFRADITSNEHGLGQQNPASVNIHKFANPSTVHQRLPQQNVFIRPINEEDTQNYHQYAPQINPGYIPVVSSFASPTSGGPSWYRRLENDYQAKYLSRNSYDSERHHVVDSSYSNSPRDHYFNQGLTRDDVARAPHSSILTDRQELDVLRSADRSVTNNKLDREQVVGNRKFSGQDSYLKNPEVEYHLDHDRIVSNNQLGSSYNPPLSGLTRMSMQVRTNPNRNRESISLGIPQKGTMQNEHASQLSTGVNLLVNSPQSVVHQALPDCTTGKISSAILCKPPLTSGVIYTNTDTSTTSSVEQKPVEIPNPSSESDSIRLEHENTEDNDRTEMSRIQSIFAKKLLRLMNPDGVIPPHMLPNSFPLHSGLYSRSFKTKTKSKRPCPKPEHVDDDSESLDNDLAFRSSLNTHSLSYDQHKSSDSRKYEQPQLLPGLRSYGSNYASLRQSESSNPMLNLNSQNQYTFVPLPGTFINSLLKSEAAMRLNVPLSSKLQLLGVVIAPKSPIQNTDSNDFENGFEDMPGQNDKSNQSIRASSTEYERGVALHKSLHEDSNYELSLNTEDFPRPVNNHLSDIEMQDDPGSTAQNVANNLNNNSQQRIKNSFSDRLHGLNSERSNSQFLILDEPPPSKFLQRSNTDSRTTTDRHQRYRPTNLSSQIQNPTLRMFRIRKPASSLYDSRGVPIKPENVPMHLHRFNPPSSIGSLPWRFSIPRPSAPVSLVMPPKPPVLS